MTLTLKTLHALFNEGAPNSAQLHLLGVKKARRGWLKQMVGREITDDLYQQVLSIKGRKPKGANKEDWRQGRVVKQPTQKAMPEPERPIQLHDPSPLYPVLQHHKEMAYAVNLIREQIFHLDDEERMQMFDAVRHGYCCECGSKNLDCQCSNDE